MAIGVFHDFDTDEDDLMTTTEFAYVYATHCQDCEKTIDDMFMQYDLDQDYKFGPEEFIELYCNEIIGKGDTEPPVPEELFEEYDTNHNELICVDELETIFNLYCYECGYTLEDLVAQYDETGDGCLCSLEFAEMMCYLTGVCPPEGETRPVDIFTEFDGNNDGKLSNTEFSIIYYLYCMECEQSLEEAVAQYDVDHDYLLSLEEYSKFSCEILGICGCNHEGNTCAPIAFGIFQEYDEDEDDVLNTYEFAFIYNEYCNYEKSIYDL